MLRALLLLAFSVIPASAQVSPASTMQASLQFTHVWMRPDGGTIQGASGSGLTARFGIQPVSSQSRLLAEAAITYVPGKEDAFDANPPVWAINLGAAYSAIPLGGAVPVVNPFASVAVGLFAYDAPPDDPNACRPEEGCMDESPDLHGTKPSIALGGGLWMGPFSGLSARLDLRVHRRLGAHDTEGWSPEFSVGAGYHF